MTSPEEHARACAQHIAYSQVITFGEMNSFLATRGVALDGGESLLGEHINQPHVFPSTTLLCPVSAEYVEIVSQVFQVWPVILAIGDVADFKSDDEPWFVAWNGGPIDYESKPPNAVHLDDQVIQQLLSLSPEAKRAVLAALASMKLAAKLPHTSRVSAAQMDWPVGNGLRLKFREIDPEVIFDDAVPVAGRLRQRLIVDEIEGQHETR
ncbi:hypothetical protein H7J86_05580 [Mycobacterium hackensackense]|uniref:hypothetical protein n=1 Tax=Mycobacterium hackensackense TaxID=228909 RepID=UPI0022658243|nr:hypothetical protein [Mycobacterium hackensackense]MCV7251627.1 hypothetical protein [Mycobacterium hackensackense]